MAEMFRVKIDLEKLAANLAAAEGQPYTRDEVEAFLKGMGFRRTGEEWLAEPANLRVLDADEYSIVQKM
jgi:hypothetical protein